MTKVDAASTLVPIKPTASGRATLTGLAVPACRLYPDYRTQEGSAGIGIGFGTAIVIEES